MSAQFSIGHKSSVRGLAFSPLNKLLLCSIGLDKNVVFYDINDKVIVKRIKTETPLQSVSFCADGHTIAIGASNYGAILVYDLRKSSKEIAKICTGHMATINSLRFMNKPTSKSSESEGKTPKLVKTADVSSKTADLQIKTIEQIREEAKRASVQTKQPDRKEVSPQPVPATKVERLEPPRLEQQQHSAQRPQMTKDEREAVKAIVDEKFGKFSQDVQAMINNFQIEMIRQFEIQRSSLESLVTDYLIEEEVAESEQTESDSYDVFFFEKYV